MCIPNRTPASVTTRPTDLRVAPVGHHLEGGQESGQLLLPVVQGGGRRDHQERTPDAVPLGQVGQEGDRLHRLTQTHLVRQDTVNALCGEAYGNNVTITETQNYRHLGRESETKHSDSTLRLSIREDANKQARVEARCTKFPK